VKRITIIIFLAILVVLLALGMNGLSPAGTQQSAPTVTPVSGPSLLKHLGITNTQSSAMGRMGGQMPAAPSERKEPENLTKGTSSEPLGSMINRILSLFRSSGKLPSELLNETFVLAGSDLYRLNCQSCHGPEGKGAPPEIKSLIDPVRGTSPTLLRQRMEDRGHPIEEAFARQLAASADSTLRQRLQQGGEKMPSFRHLRGDEVDALLEYLKKLAGVPNSGHKELLVTQSVARVGEHLVKGTCHICHNATGPGGGHMAMMRGIIPSLESFPAQNSLQQIIRQIKLGSSGMMSMMGGEKMPAFPYITEEESAAAYLYLIEYSPNP
jgi:mono/diheme cytochrome c family protein